METVNWMMLVPCLILFMRGLLYLQGPQDVHAQYVTKGKAHADLLLQNQTLWQWVKTNWQEDPDNLVKIDRFVRIFGGCLLLMGIGLAQMAWRYDPEVHWVPLTYVIGLTICCGILFVMTLHFRGPAYLVVGAYTLTMTAIILNCVGVDEALVLVGASITVAALLAGLMHLLLRQRLSWERP